MQALEALWKPAKPFGSPSGSQAHEALQEGKLMKTFGSPLEYKPMKPFRRLSEALREHKLTKHFGSPQSTSETHWKPTKHFRNPLEALKKPFGNASPRSPLEALWEHKLKKPFRSLCKPAKLLSLPRKSSLKTQKPTQAAKPIEQTRKPAKPAKQPV